MRWRGAISVLLVGMLTLCAGWWVASRPGAVPADRSPATPAVESPVQTEAVAPAPTRPEDPAPDPSSTNTVAAQHQAYVVQRCAELEDLAMDEKPESLASILGELTNRDPEIRQAALNAAVQFGSRDAIPKLLEAVNQTEDEDEQVALLQAVKFLKLPTLSELAEQARTNGAAQP